MFVYRLIVLVLCFFSSIVLASGQSKQAIESRWRFSYESMPLTFNEDIGLLGIHYDIFPSNSYPSWYVGLGGYSGASGEDGRFFSAGLTSGWLHKISSNVSYRQYVLGV